jgi:hypothetical protein
MTYHEEGPCCVVGEDDACDEEHERAQELVGHSLCIRARGREQRMLVSTWQSAEHWYCRQG